jgi:YidC/Oxa1 family membrane protein insertase
VGAFQTTVDTQSTGGFFDVLLVAIGSVLRWITNTLGFGNYLVGICVFAIIIEILMLPFAIKQQKNTIRQASLRPKEMAIRNKYKGRTDQVTMQKMQQEIQEFYQRENFSPYSGCLPLLIQMPIIIALYNIVIDPLHYVLGQTAGVSQALATFATTARAAGGAGMSMGNNGGTIAILSNIKDGLINLDGLKNFAYYSNGDSIVESLEGILNSIPNFSIGSINFGLNPSFEHFDVLLLVPVLTFVTYFLTSKINRKLSYQPTASEGADSRQVACSNTMMDVSMPMMSTFFTFMVPALIGVYWMFRSLIGMLKQYIIAKMMPLPTFTEEDYKQAEKEMKGKKVVVKSENAGKVRSLHHIDDEDFDDTRERALERKAAIEERERQEQAEKSKKALFGAAPMKEENKKKQDRNGEENAEEGDQDKK